eukprot:3118844-Pleurochrysis_carterae.AAC.1
MMWNLASGYNQKPSLCVKDSESGIATVRKEHGQNDSSKVHGCQGEREGAKTACEKEGGKGAADIGGGHTRCALPHANAVVCVGREVRAGCSMVWHAYVVLGGRSFGPGLENGSAHFDRGGGVGGGVEGH